MKKIERNQALRLAARQRGIFLWQIADKVGISEPQLTRWLRRELTSEQKERCWAALETLTERGETDV